MSKIVILIFLYTYFYSILISYQSVNGTQGPLWWFTYEALDRGQVQNYQSCLLYTSDAADDTPCVDLGGRRIIKKKII